MDPRPNRENNRSRKQTVEAAAAVSSEKIGKAHYAKSQCLMKIAAATAHEAISAGF